jgi:hypothetical protein
MTPVPGWIHLFLDVPRAGWADSVAFWSAATRWEPSAPHGEAGQFLTLDPESGDGWLKLQATDDDAPRVHLDLDGTTGCPGRSSGERDGPVDSDAGARPACLLPH